MPGKVPTPSKAARRVTGAELARELGVRSQGIYKLIKRGVIERGADGLIDLELAKVAIASRVRASGKTAAAVVSGAAAAQPAAAPAPHPSTAIYQTARAEREVEEQLLTRMKRMEKQNLLIDRASTLTAIYTAFRRLRDDAMPLGRRVAARAATLTDPRDVQQLIDDELRLIFTNFAERTLATMVAKLPKPLDEQSAHQTTEEAA